MIIAGAVEFISPELKKFFNNDRWEISILLQEEISTYIKGRAGEDMNIYMSLPRSKNVLPLKTEDDYKTIFSIFNKYQDKLISLNLFDSDDIDFICTQRNLKRQYGKRRRMSNGFDIMYIDEHIYLTLMNLACFIIY